ncbi:proline-rich nuclear receptor coactivator 2-like [Clytia hemisphaerica]|uniref:Uncharacterized protein n=1 Tax=Clytia hemisphaerica TaxID=252671 RepID=A0A7M5VAI2_9CNID|eukprot:TCONS_00023996-protein
MTGRINHHNRRNKREGRRSPSKTVHERDSPSPSYKSFECSFERSSPVLIQSRASWSSSDSEDEGTLPYAGAKFNSPPPATLLPTPPMSWLGTSRGEQNLNEMSSHLRQLLKVS